MRTLPRAPAHPALRVPGVQDREIQEVLERFVPATGSPARRTADLTAVLLSADLELWPGEVMARSVTAALLGASLEPGDLLTSNQGRHTPTLDH